MIKSLVVRNFFAISISVVAFYLILPNFLAYFSLGLKTGCFLLMAGLRRWMELFPRVSHRLTVMAYNYTYSQGYPLTIRYARVKITQYV